MTARMAGTALVALAILVVAGHPCAGLAAGAPPRDRAEAAGHHTAPGWHHGACELARDGGSGAPGIVLERGPHGRRDLAVGGPAGPPPDAAPRGTRPPFLLHAPLRL
jgi:hypothetical protein